MHQQGYAATAWEAEAARRREVVRADFAAAARARRHTVGLIAGSSDGIVNRLASWVATVARRTTATPVHETRSTAPCPPSVRAVKPGC